MLENVRSIEERNYGRHDAVASFEEEAQDRWLTWAIEYEAPRRSCAMPSGQRGTRARAAAMNLVPVPARNPGIRAETSPRPPAKPATPRSSEHGLHRLRHPGAAAALRRAGLALQRCLQGDTQRERVRRYYEQDRAKYHAATAATRARAMQTRKGLERVRRRKREGARRHRWHDSVTLGRLVAYAVVSQGASAQRSVSPPMRGGTHEAAKRLPGTLIREQRLQLAAETATLVE